MNIRLCMSSACQHVLFEISFNFPDGIPNTEKREEVSFEPQSLPHKRPFTHMSRYDWKTRVFGPKKKYPWWFQSIRKYMYIHKLLMQGVKIQNKQLLNKKHRNKFQKKSKKTQDPRHFLQLHFDAKTFIATSMTLR